MSEFLCHDFKSPRTDTSRRLPASFRFVPVAFYASLVLGAYFITMAVVKGRKAKAEMIAAEQVKIEHEQTKAKYDAEKKEIDIESAKAALLAKWVEGTRVLQPLCVATARAVKGEVRVANMSLDRNPQLPAQMDMVLRLTGADATHLREIEQAIGAHKYRCYSPQQARSGAMMDYSATLVYVNE